MTFVGDRYCPDFDFNSPEALLSLQKLRNTGANYIALVITEFQDYTSSTEIYPLYKDFIKNDDIILYSIKSKSNVDEFRLVKQSTVNKNMVVLKDKSGKYGVLMPNRIKSGGVSRKITNAADRKRLKDIMKSFNYLCCVTNENSQNLVIHHQLKIIYSKYQFLQRDMKIHRSYLKNSLKNLQQNKLQEKAFCAMAKLLLQKL